VAGAGVDGPDGPRRAARPDAAYLQPRHHVTPYGTFNLDMEARLPIDGVTGDASAAATTAGLMEV